jgi:Porin PorA
MRVLARVLLGLGVFLLVAGILAVTWVPGMVKKTPLDVDTTTIYGGTAAKLDPLTGAFDTKPAYAIRYTKADSKKSSDDTVLMVENACAVFDTGGAKVCVNGNDPDLITATTDIFATDRVTALAVQDKNLPADAVPHEGLINKFPFDVEKKTYPFWDGDVGNAVDIGYVGTTNLFGLDTYEFQYTVKDVPINIADDDPATPEDDAIPGTYDNVVTVYVDPKTGSIVKSGQDQQQYLEDGTPAADVKLTQTDASVKVAVDDAKKAGTQLTILLTVLPIVGFVGGLLCLLGGIALLLRERSGGEGGGQRVQEKPKVGAGV